MGRSSYDTIEASAESFGLAHGSQTGTTTCGTATAPDRTIHSHLCNSAAPDLRRRAAKAAVGTARRGPGGPAQRSGALGARRAHPGRAAAHAHHESTIARRAVRRARGAGARRAAAVRVAPRAGAPGRSRRRGAGQRVHGRACRARRGRAQGLRRVCVCARRPRCGPGRRGPRGGADVCAYAPGGEMSSHV